MCSCRAVRFCVLFIFNLSHFKIWFLNQIPWPFCGIIFKTICMYICVYYIDMSVLPKNRQLVFSIWNYIRDTSEIFSTSSLVKILLTSFLCFSFVFLLFFFKFSKHLYLCNKKKITRWLKDMKFVFSWKKDLTRSPSSLVK